MPVDKNSTAAKPGSRLRELGLVLAKAPTALGAYFRGRLVALSERDAPVVNGKLPIPGRLGENPRCRARPRGGADCGNERFGGRTATSRRPDPSKKLVKLSVVLATAEQFVEHAASW